MKSIVDFLTSEMPQTESQETVEKIEDVETVETPKDETNEAEVETAETVESQETVETEESVEINEEKNPIFGDEIIPFLSKYHNILNKYKNGYLCFPATNTDIVVVGVNWNDFDVRNGDENLEAFCEEYGINDWFTEGKKIYNLRYGESYVVNDVIWVCVK